MLEIRDFVYTFSKDNKPAAYCEIGDTVIFHTQDCFGGQIKSEAEYIHDIDFSRTNPATGPLYVRDTKPGDVLAVDILKIETAESGIIATLKGYGPLWDSCELRTRILKIEDGFITFQGIRFPAIPMIGVIGCAPEGKAVASANSFSGGGNMDSRVITAGTTVYLPVRTPGALLEMGDVHAAMGDGEVCETGVEIAARITVKVRVIRNFDLRWPLTKTRDFWFVNTNGHDCDTAIRKGYQELQRLIMGAYGFDATDACLYMSAQARVEANQAVLGRDKSDEEGNTFRVGVPVLKDRPLIF